MPPRDTNDRPISSVLDEMLKKFHLDEKMHHVRLVNAWEPLMGAAVANRTTELKIIDRKLYVTLSSAALRQELFQHRANIIRQLNQEAGSEVIDDIVFR